MGNNLNELASYMVPLAAGLMADAIGADIDPVIIDTGRNYVQQQAKMAQGVSWTSNSKHLPQPPEGKSEAIDIAPRSYLTMKLWNPSGPLWAKLGALGKARGLEWGGDWKEHPDPSHFQYIHSSTEQQT